MSDGNQCLNEGYDELLILNGRSEAIVADLPKAAIVMKVGPHSNMSLSEIIESKKIEEGVYGVHFWGYSGYILLRFLYKPKWFFANFKIWWSHNCQTPPA